jgi:hypothetical protein
MKHERMIMMNNGVISDRYFPLDNGQQCFNDVTKKTLTHYDGYLYDAHGVVVTQVKKGANNVR